MAASKNGSSKAKVKIPGKEPGASSEGPKAARTSGRALPLENKLKEFFGGVSLIAGTAGDEFSSTIIAARGDELAYVWAKLAQQNDGVKRVLTTLLEGSAWSEAVIVSLSVVIPIGWHYGVIPDRIGVPVTMMSGMVPESRDQGEPRAAADTSASAQADPPTASDMHDAHDAAKDAPPDAG